MGLLQGEGGEDEMEEYGEDQFDPEDDDEYNPEDESEGAGYKKRKDSSGDEDWLREICIDVRESCYFN